MNTFMEVANNNAKIGFENNEGGPFGAVIVSKDGEIIAKGNNRVLIDKDPTAHAEMVAIRRACKKLNTYDLSSYVLYTSCEPCPMCLSAIIWSNIKDVYYGCTSKDAADIGFRDDDIYEYIKGDKKDLLKMKEIDREGCKVVFDEFIKKNGKIY